MQRSWNSLAACCAILAALAFDSPAKATILNFNIDNFPSGTAAGTATLLSGAHVVYGDNVTSTAMTIGSFTYNYGMGNGFTPNVTVGYTLGPGATNQMYYTDGGSPPSPLWTDVNFLAGSGANPHIHYITFVPTAPYGVTVNSFNVFGYASSLTHTYSWNLRDSLPTGTILASGGPTAFTGALASPSIVNTGFQGHYGTLVLEIIQSAGSGGAWGMDDLNFDQVPPLPEPSTLSLLGLGLVGLVAHKRRRKSN